MAYRIDRNRDAAFLKEEELDLLTYHKFEPGDRVVVCGGVAKLGDVLFDRLRRFTEEAAFVADAGHIDIRPGLLGDDAVLAGALLLAENPRLHTV